MGCDGLHLCSTAFMFLAVYDSSEEITQVLDHEAGYCLATSELSMTLLYKKLQLVSSCLMCPSYAEKIGKTLPCCGQSR